MSHKNKLRSDKTCLNCNHVVDQRYCPNCGQENTDTRKTFHHLFVHFFEDLTHYENAFWKTIKNLLFKPAALTKEYLSGKRLSYLAPVRLYIFISFVTFFMIAVLPGAEDKGPVKVNNTNTNIKTKSGYNYNFKSPDNVVEIDSVKEDSAEACKEILRIEELESKGVLQPVEADSIKKLIEIGKKEQNESKNNKNIFSSGYKSIREMDSIRKINPKEISSLEYWFNKKSIELGNKYTETQLKELFVEKAKQNFPKTLFLYMPLFALILWFFHNKKRWYYFDHGIFTLHYFSFLLLIQLILLLISEVLLLFGDSTLISVIDSLINFAGYVWMFYYFFPAHHRFYGESRVVSFIKSVFIFFINSILFSIVLALFVVYTFANLH